MTPLEKYNFALKNHDPAEAAHHARAELDRLGSEIKAILSHRQRREKGYHLRVQRREWRERMDSVRS